jgi:cytochrome c oxidase subunit 2
MPAAERRHGAPGLRHSRGASLVTMLRRDYGPPAPPTPGLPGQRGASADRSGMAGRGGWTGIRATRAARVRAGYRMHRLIGRWFGKALGLATAALVSMGEALAQSAPASGASGGVVGQTHSDLGAPIPWGIGLQPAGGAVKEAIHDFNTLVLWIIILITAFVTVLLGYAIWRFRESANPNPSKTSHHTVLEVAWTVVPVLILVVIAIPSFRLIYYADRARDADLTINVQGRQWYWHYAYPDSNFAFDSRPIPTEELRDGQLRNLSVDEPLVIPVGANVRILTTGQDVIHSFFVPALGVQKYTIPGRTLETWFRADRPGTFYGQCNQICGTNHWFMPIEVRAVPQAEFQAWVEQAKTKYAAAEPVAPDAARQLAALAPAAAAEATVATSETRRD